MLPQAILNLRRLTIVAGRLALFASANYAAFWLRFDGAIPAHALAGWRTGLPWVLIIEGLTFLAFGLYAGMWRYIGIRDLRNLLCATIISNLTLAVLIRLNFPEILYPRSVIVLNPLLLMCFAGGVRILPSLYHDVRIGGGGKRVLVFGAGDAGEMIVRQMRNTLHSWKPVGFVDDDPLKIGRRIHGVPVLGTRKDLGQIIAKVRPDEILMAIPGAESKIFRGILRALEPFKIPIKTLPNLREILEERVALSQVRNLSPEDLLDRRPVKLNAEPLSRLMTGRRVLVTGAAGSIGSELCRQIAKLGPGLLILYERYENGLFAIENSLIKEFGSSHLVAKIGDVSDIRRVGEVFAEYRPEIVFHAAAHKHVPLMELNPSEAVKNNVTGTRIVAEAAERYNAERFILISTDKAVNPTSVMGATKRVAELMIQAMADESSTCFASVRFGNVLGSNGSVVPRFLEQIKAGGPVTITHPEMRRFFMLIPEAVQLVLHAASLAEPKATYILEMGEQVSVLEMARNLIRLAGFVPDEDVRIEFVGLRPGEKLFEELIGPDEAAEPSPVPQVLRVRTVDLPDPIGLARRVALLEQLAAGGKELAVLTLLHLVVSNFKNSLVNRNEVSSQPATSAPADVHNESWAK
jgi:FlaA1/EpsC-like NDP-sugar epimerase